jgi:putative Mn2+ efflux pump MntP
LILKLLAFVLPLGLDSFAVAAAIGAAGPLNLRARIRISIVFLVFEGGMPLVGLALGVPLARAIGGTASYLAAIALIGVGAWMLRNDDDENEKTARIATTHGIALIGLGIGISLDELAMGFGLGLAHLPIVPAVAAIACQAFAATQLGLYLGARVSEHFRETAERVAGVVLIALGVFLLIERLIT